MRRFVRIKKLPERPQIASIYSGSAIFRPIMLHATIDQDRAVGSRLTFSEHVHDFYHIVLYTKGQGWYSKKGRFLPAEPGTCVLVHPGQRHEFVTRRQTAVYSELTFSYETDTQQTLKLPFAKLLSLYSGMDTTLFEDSILSAENRQSLSNLMVQAVDYLNSSRPSSGYYVHRTLAHILDFLMEYCTQKPLDPPIVDDRFSRIRLWLEEHYLEPVTMNQLAQMAGVTKSYFFRAFKKAFGMPPLAYQQMLRIEAAKTLLRATSLSCGEVAFRAGFTDVLFFHRIFKRNTGSTPKQFRRLSS
ncbi:MAG: AraC family transcriptional regulator [Planctomycetaceae bacterium]|nr:AraC family transcriptional regulator [Planctomycetaceae bacterium]